MSRVENKEKHKEYAHNHYIKHKRPKTKIGQAELKIIKLEKDNEELIKRRDIVLLKLAEKTTQIVNLEAKLAQAKMNESFEKEKKDNAFKLIEELKQQLAEKKKELAITDEALKMACLSLRGKCDYCKYKDDEICPPDHHCSNLVMEYFLEQAEIGFAEVGKTKAKEIKSDIQ